VQTMHELKQLVDDGFEESPVCTQETRVLSNNIHDVRCNDGLVVLASFLFTQSQQLLGIHAYSYVHVLHSDNHTSASTSHHHSQKA